MFYGPVSCSSYTEFFVKRLTFVSYCPWQYQLNKQSQMLPEISVRPPSIIDNWLFQSLIHLKMTFNTVHAYQLQQHLIPAYGWTPEVMFFIQSGVLYNESG